MSLAQGFEQDYWFFNWDLKSGYHHVNIYEPHQDHLGFSWIINDEVRYFVFKVLPFGLSTACFCFTKLLRPFSTRWRSVGDKCFIFIDDGISGHKTRHSVCLTSARHKSDLLGAGFVFSEKCHWEHRQIGTWLGLIINTIKFDICIPEDKINKLQEMLDIAIQSKHCSYRLVAKIAGFLQSLFLAVGPALRLFTRNMHFAIATRTYWNDIFLIQAQLMEELKFWRYNITAFNGYSIRPKYSFDYVIYTDASSYGFGRYIDKSHFAPVRIMWLQGRSSTPRELKAIHNLVLYYAPMLRHSKVKIFSDNQNACSIIQKGSTKPLLNDIAVDIFLSSLHGDIQLCPQWMPRSENEQADILSKYIDKDDWKLHPDIFSYLNNLWGPHTVDRFVSHYNYQINRFNYRFASPGCEAVNALAQNWS